VHRRPHEPAELDGFVAELDGAGVGLLSYVLEDDACEIVSLAAEVQGRGIGTALLDAAIAFGMRRTL